MSSPFLPLGGSGASTGTGPAASSDKYYHHVQGSASTTWTITHNLGKNPSVTVIDSGGTVVEGDIAYTSSNVVTVTFTSSFAGDAYCN